MNNLNNDHAQDILLKILHMKGLKDLENLLKKCYSIQKKYQYETERNTSIVLIQKLIDEEVSKKREKKDKEVDK